MEHAKNLSSIYLNGVNSQWLKCFLSKCEENTQLHNIDQLQLPL